MLMSMQRCLLGLAIGATLALSAASAAIAKSAYDGEWSVLIVTERGTCDRGYRYPVKIVNGVVRHAEADSSFSISGRVVGSGGVRVSVSRGSQGAIGAGRLSARGGSGTWKSASNECSGTWSADRRG